jgi:hypothetical protein
VVACHALPGRVKEVELVSMARAVDVIRRRKNKCFMGGVCGVQ